MKIEIGESALYSWLRHVRGCTVTQLNWKASPTWRVPQERFDDICRLKQSVKQGFGDKEEWAIFKNDQEPEQILKQVECDVIGIQQGESCNKVYAVESAFHSRGLQYGSKDETCAKVVSKVFRIALALHLYMPNCEYEIIFAAPKIHNNVMKELPQALDRAQNILINNGFGCSVHLIANDDFKKVIIDPCLELARGDVSDTSELFMRSLQLVGVFEGTKKHARQLDAGQSRIPNGNSSVHAGTEEAPLNEQLLPVEVLPESTSSPEFQALPVGKIANIYLRRWLESSCSLEMAQLFEDKEYSNQQFHINFPLLQSVRTPDANGYFRHSPKPLNIQGKVYYLCTQWYERQKKGLIEWLNTHQQREA